MFVLFARNFSKNRPPASARLQNPSNFSKSQLNVLGFNLNACSDLLAGHNFARAVLVDSSAEHFSNQLSFPAT